MILIFKNIFENLYLYVQARERRLKQQEYNNHEMIKENGTLLLERNERVSSNGFLKVDEVKKSTARRDIDTLEISMYRCVPIASSVPNLRDFSYVSHRCDAIKQKSSQDVSRTSPNRGSLQDLNDSNGFVKRTKTQSESQSYDDELVQSSLQNLNSNIPVKYKEESLRKVITKMPSFKYGMVHPKDIINDPNDKQSLCEIPQIIIADKESIPPPEVKVKQRSPFMSTIMNIFDPKVILHPKMIMISAVVFLYSQGVPHALMLVHAQVICCNVNF